VACHGLNHFESGEVVMSVDRDRDRESQNRYDWIGPILLRIICFRDVVERLTDTKQ
jgi:hypothetical protein